jgi:DNA-binding HxlR family transcriptional regulator
MLLFIEEMHPDRKVTKNDFRRTIPLLSYYGISAYLRDNGIIELYTVNDKNQKVWALTEKGKKFANLVMEMKKVLNNGAGKDMKVKNTVEDN